ncbi:protein phosphatase CheZ [Stappia sp. F7233]|uniref:Protein phosphatase CheZ n=1 Tax=Stappia albiluteola TaxID=2758565 RepID=A0A839AF42_9HYPH|nr:protein phosphatase CheZ [Stappia albiluteola]MBA5777726.1 protein phosphatase CheZ [Stappia albiluteola]
MAAKGPPSPLRDADFEAILDTLAGSAQGRWFLDEYLRRNQKPDTQVVLAAIERLEKAMIRDRTVPDINRIRLNIADMQEAIDRTKREIGNIKHESEYGNRFQEASDELDAIVSQTEGATQEILAASEAIQEIAWQLREEGANQTACDEIDARATEIFMACSFQDLTGQRTQKIVQVLQYLESRINLMINIWGMEDATAEEPEIRMDTRPDAHLLNGPQLEGRGTSQDAVDALFGNSHDDKIEADAEDISFDAIAVDEAEGETADVFAPVKAEVTAATPTVEVDLDDEDDGIADVFEKPAAPRPEPQRPTAGANRDDDEADGDFDIDLSFEERRTAQENETEADIDWEAELAVIEAEEDGEDELKRLTAGERQSLFS